MNLGEIKGFYENEHGKFLLVYCHARGNTNAVPITRKLCDALWDSNHPWAGLIEECFQDEKYISLRKEGAGIFRVEIQ